MKVGVSNMKIEPTFQLLHLLALFKDQSDRKL